MLQVVNYILHVKGAGENTRDANQAALSRLSKASEALVDGRTFIDPGVDARQVDPGGGGGPCEPLVISQDFDIGPGALPEAQNDDDDDD
ncbi:MAG: hypothetical protein ACR2QC_04020 [Gammaproteobacteria bacterium]